MSPGTRIRSAIAVISVITAVGCSNGDSASGGDAAGQPGSSVPSAPDAESTPPSRGVGGPTVPITEPADIAVLSAALLGPTEVGVPDSWAIRDLGPDVPPEQLQADDTRIAFGVIDCPIAPPARETAEPWLSRRFAAPEVPLDNGLLQIEIIVEIDTTSQDTDRAAELDSCEANEYTEIVTTERDVITPGGNNPGGSEAEIFASPSSDVAFPSRHAIVTAHDADRNVTVVFSGLDTGISWARDASDLSDRVLDLLV